MSDWLLSLLVQSVLEQEPFSYQGVTNLQILTLLNQWAVIFVTLLNRTLFELTVPQNNWRITGLINGLQTTCNRMRNILETLPENHQDRIAWTTTLNMFQMTVGHIMNPTQNNLALL
jgi:hypothetical protein